MDNELRLQVFLARAGIASRRKSEELIKQGRVRVNGTVIREMGIKVTPSDTIEFDGKKMKPEKRQVYLAVHKPKAMLCSSTHQDKRPIIFDLLKDSFSERLFSIGRLDYLSSGLLLITNDGDFAKTISHPSSCIEKEYLVETRRPIPVDMLERWKTSGIQIDKEQYKINKYRLRNERSVELILTEGKNREIRNVFASVNLAVSRVHRVRIGSILLKGIQPGHWRSLKKHEIRQLLLSAGGNNGSRD